VKRCHQILIEVNFDSENMSPPLLLHQNSANVAGQQSNFYVGRDGVAILLEKMHDTLMRLRRYEFRNRCMLHCDRFFRRVKPKFLLLPLIVLVVVQIFYSVQMNYNYINYSDGRSSTLNNNSREYDYDEIYSSGGTHESYKDKRLFNFQSFHNYTSPDILMNGCSLTVALTDPRIPPYGYNHPAWFMLESVASFVPYACVVIHTASCQIIKQTSNLPLLPTERQTEVAAQFIYERSLPLFRRMMERGQVRIAILEKGVYSIEKCAQWDISAVTMNVHFWREQFIDGIDSDMILFMQSDSVLCHHLDIDLWAHFAYVGSPWGKGGLWPSSCDVMREYWRSWAPKCSLSNPDYDLPNLCTPGHGGAVGNGGFSLRNKTWMIQAIETCPTKYSGLEQFSADDTQPEDVYFSIILTGMHAPMPSSFEASLFATEQMFPEGADTEYFTVTPLEKAETIRRLWGDDTGPLMYERMHRVETYVSSTSNESGSDIPHLHTIPIGFHTPWNYHQDVIKGVQIQQECKFLKFLFNILE
jgi:hypothetical protein